MTDRELLEKAAKAAGMQHMRWGGPFGMVRMIDPSRPESTGSIGDYWNPLEDDGDAFRLMVALGIRPKFDGYAEMATFDELSKTRRAIVRAATAMGDAQ